MVVFILGISISCYDVMAEILFEIHRVESTLGTPDAKYFCLYHARKCHFMYARVVLRNKFFSEQFAMYSTLHYAYVLQTRIHVIGISNLVVAITCAVITRSHLSTSTWIYQMEMTPTLMLRMISYYCSVAFEWDDFL